MIEVEIKAQGQNRRDVIQYLEHELQKLRLPGCVGGSSRHEAGASCEFRVSGPGLQAEYVDMVLEEAWAYANRRSCGLAPSNASRAEVDLVVEHAAAEAGVDLTPQVLFQVMQRLGWPERD